MAYLIYLKRSSEPGRRPDNLKEGELWINLADQVIGIGGQDGKSIVTIDARTGAVQIPEGVSVDEAAREFWETVHTIATYPLQIDREDRSRISYRDGAARAAAPEKERLAQPPRRSLWQILFD